MKFQPLSFVITLFLMISSFPSEGSPPLFNGNPLAFNNLHPPSFEEIPAVIRNNQELSFKLYSLFNKREENILFSPYAILSFFTALQKHTDLRCMEKINRTFLIEGDPHRWASSFHLLLQGIIQEPSQEPFRIKLFSSSWLPSNFDWSSSYLTEAAKFGKSEFHFYGKEDRKDKLINSLSHWIEEKGLPVSSSSTSFDELLAGRSELILSNLFYFSAVWRYGFDISEKEESFFYPTLTRKVPISMMEKNVRYNLFLHEDFSFLEVPYELGYRSSQRIALYLLLPKRQGNLKKIESMLSWQKVVEWRKKMKLRKVHLLLPLISLSRTIPLHNHLKTWGIEDCFSSAPYFSAIANGEALHRLHLYHTPFLNFGLHGSFTEELKDGLAQHPTVYSSSGEVDFIVEHPFIFFVIDQLTDTILLMGKINDPS